MKPQKIGENITNLKSNDFYKEIQNISFLKLIDI